MAGGPAGWATMVSWKACCDPANMGEPLTATAATPATGTPPSPTATPTTPCPTPPLEEPVLCRHCGRTASNGISCEGACVADSGY